MGLRCTEVSPNILTKFPSEKKVNTIFILVVIVQVNRIPSTVQNRAQCIYIMG